ncbi:hypothetical protein GT045_26475 [Streptomyces sp. SID486]|uniref:DUF3566 domain-containing protein n=1 Tax=unclassified Streptomyces TaxID=2593676 RepID=UPI00136CA297|nr:MULTISPECIES: DUF3566 domain-containing protein [unclassified Streptomyces]MYW18264.1 hypothetical protein [Streptomyces sp. SID2955]MYW46287.1 hypothetical protein [Streptomyces sp. SID161]MYX98259.1 hypothetical protein [Streptomyces sp. SID486]
MVTSSLLLGGLGVVAVVTACVAWIMVEAIAPDILPALTTVLGISVGVVSLEVVLGTCLATLGAFLYNLSAHYSGGVEIAVTDGGLTGPTAPTAQALLLLVRARDRVRRRLRTYHRFLGAGAVRQPLDVPDTGARSGTGRPERAEPDGPGRAGGGDLRHPWS